MANVTEQATEVGDMLLQALQNTLGLGPEEALAQAQTATGVTPEQVDSADMGQVFEYMCDQPDLSPQLQGFLTNQAENYNNYGNVSQGGSSYTGGGSGGGGGYGGSYGGGGSANAQIVQQVTQNYNYQEINDNHIDILGPVNGNIDIDQDNDDVDVTGDGNAVNTGDGDQNAATGDGSSAAQSEYGDANSNTGDGVIQGNDGSTIEDNVLGDGNTVLNNDGTITDSSIGFGDGNVQGDVYNEEGAANSQGGDATGQSVDTNVNSDVNEEHGDGDLNDNDSDGGYEPPVLVREPLSDIDDNDGGSGYGSDSGHDDYHAPEVNVNVEGGDGDQHVDAPDDDVDPS